MSGKRRADKELNRDNWDEEEEPEDSGTFRKATEDVLKNRVIKTAKRRVTNGAPDSERPSIFAGFTGFGNKIDDKKSSFSFVSNLKGVDTVNTIKELGKNGSETSGANAVFKPPLPSLSFSSNTSSIPTVDIAKSTQPSSSTKYEPSMNKTNAAGDLDSSCKLNTLSNKLKTVSNEESIFNNTGSTNNDVAETPDEVFLKKLRSLNLLCTEWIIKHLNENLSYILTPIFDDYKKYLTQLREERQQASSSFKKPRVESCEREVSWTSNPIQLQSGLGPDSKNSVPKINFGIGSFANKEEKTLPDLKMKSTFAEKQTTGFKFFDKSKENDNFKPGNTDFKLEFKFTAVNEIKPTNGESNPSPSPFFSVQSSGISTTNPLLGQSSNMKPHETTENDDVGPPTVEDVTIKEDGSVYDQKCKIFIKKDGNFIDHGVGFLFLKLVGDEQKCQLIVRANNKLATIMINVLLTSNIPVQKIGKNNVMLICCPTPETKQPTSILVKVKTSEDADQLLINLEKYRK